jgi:cellulose synthase/poly-beta-1,6-N-acetylglucosamine synthase-like glycosyltransferase
MVVLTIGWNKAVHAIKPASIPGIDEPFISVIIPVRNESNNIGFLLEDLSRQQHKYYEVIVVDDHSDDNTVEIVEDHVRRRTNIVLLKNIGTGKKSALSQGIHSSRGTIIITTDGDCRVTENWLAGISGYFEDKSTQMVFGCVRMERISFFGSLQCIEFAGLVGAGVATAAWGFPTMCNGANLSFRKSVFEELGGYTGNLHIPSGDDEFLMRKVLQRYPLGIKPMIDKQTIVTTQPNENLKQFIDQRIRWAGKWSTHQALFSQAVAMFVFFFQLSVISIPLFIGFNSLGLIPGLMLLLAKITLEFFFLRRISRFLGVSWSWFHFATLQVLYPWYVVVVGIVSNFSSFEWKGRKLNSLTISKN